MKFTKWTFLVICLMLSIHLYGQVEPSKTNLQRRPKLTIGIVVDQMRIDYLYRYWNHYSKAGFKRLINEGLLCSNVHYDYVPTFTGPGHASIYTGATPSWHGIVGNNWYMRSNYDTIYCVEDTNVTPLGTTSLSGRISPRNLLTTTITDEVRFATNYQSRVISISLKDRGAVLPAGHSANGAYWYDNGTGNFISSTYYMKKLPAWMEDFNAQKLSEKYVHTPWTTLLPLQEYKESTADSTNYEGLFPSLASPVFPYQFDKMGKTGYGLLRSSPWGNTLVTQAALAGIKGENLGSVSGDFLCLSYSAPDYVGHQFGTNAIETEDIYLRLDMELATLLSYLDTKVGKENYLLFLTADHAAIPNPQYLLDHKVPAGWLNADMMYDSLKSVMKKKYSVDGLLLSFNNDQLYINNSLVTEIGMSQEKFENECAQFFMKFEGVHHCLTATSLQKNEYTQGMDCKIQKGYYPKRCGDVVIVPEPGLIEYDGHTGTTHGSGYTYDTHVPLIWFGYGIKTGEDAHEYHITDIAPTLSVLLRAEFPNASCGKVISSVTGK